MTAFDLNTAETGGATHGLIPEDTVARAVFTVRPGGAGDGGWFKTSRAGHLMIDGEWTILDGPYARKKVWGYMMVDGSEIAVSITKKSLRALVEGHHGINPDDMSEAAQAKRKVGVADLNGLEGCILIGIEKSVGYDDKNKVKAVLAPGDTKYIAKGQGASQGVSQGAGQAQQAAPAAPGNKPAWA